MISKSKRLIAATSAIFVYNAILCRELFNIEFTPQIGSIESSYIAIARWYFLHPAWRGWFPLWFTGMPLNQVYQPGLHVSVAALATMLGWTPQHSYHFLTALAYCLGPVTLAILYYQWTKRLKWAIISGIVYSIVSPSCLLMSQVRIDTYHLLTARRLICLTRYGEGPHTVAVMAIPIAILLLHAAIVRDCWWAYIAAPLMYAAVMLINWPGTVGLALATISLLLALLPFPVRVAKRAILIFVAAYLVSCPWISPGTIFKVQANAQQSDSTYFGVFHLGALGVLLSILVLIQVFLFRGGAGLISRFFLHFSLLTGAISVGHEWSGLSLLPQSNRFQVEFDLAACALLCVLGSGIFGKLGGVMRICLAVFCVASGIYQTMKLREVVNSQLYPYDMASTVEYRMSKWFDEHANGTRVFAPGNVSLWMNVFSDTPQMVGCCDQGVPTFQHRIAFYTIYTGENAGVRDAEISILWLKAYGVDVVGVTGARSTEAFHPFVNPQKFEGVLKVLWRDGDNAVYDVGRRSRTLAHVLRDSDVVRAPAVHGLDVGHISRYVNAVESELNLVQETWWSPDYGVLSATLKKGDVISLQKTYDPGWTALVRGRIIPIEEDSLGMMVLRPSSLGTVSIQLKWRERDLTLLTVGAGLGTTLIGITAYLKKQRSVKKFYEPSCVS